MKRSELTPGTVCLWYRGKSSPEHDVGKVEHVVTVVGDWEQVKKDRGYTYLDTSRYHGTSGVINASVERGTLVKYMAVPSFGSDRTLEEREVVVQPGQLYPGTQADVDRWKHERSARWAQSRKESAEHASAHAERVAWIRSRLAGVGFGGQGGHAALDFSTTYQDQRTMEAIEYLLDLVEAEIE